MDTSFLSVRGLRLLYVEDEPETRELMGRALAEEYPQLSLYVAADGAEGLDLFRKHRPELVITDIKMPVMDGLQMTGEIKAIDPEVEVIALTAYSDTDFLLSAIELGFTHYILKPIDFDKFFGAVGKSLKLVNVRRQVHEQNEQIRRVNAELEEQVEERERLLVQHEAVLNSIHEGVIISDREGNLLAMNLAALALHQYQSVDQIRQQAHQFQEVFEISALGGGDVPYEQWPISRALRGERFTDYELCVRRKDTGNEFMASYSGTPVPTPHGHPMLAVVTLRDITERKQAEEALRKSEHKFSTIFHSVPATITISRFEDAECIDINEAGLLMLGYERDEVVGHSFLELGVWEKPSERKHLLEMLEEQGIVRDLEVTLKGKDGRILTVLFSAEPIEFESDRYLLSIITDITHRKELEQEVAALNAALAVRATELESANRELEAFNYTVAHDLRKPLTVINGYCQTITELCGERLDEECLGFVQEAYEGTLRMDRLISALLLFSQAAHAQPRRETANLSQTAEEVAEELKLAEPARAVTFRISPGVVLEGDANLLRVVIANLFGNAWKYTADREETLIEFGTMEVDGKQACFVRDNGIGFDMKEARDIFAPFRRLPGGQRIGGLGIGLATVERIIRRHGGKVWAEGEPEKGATFYFTL